MKKRAKSGGGWLRLIGNRHTGGGVVSLIRDALLVGVGFIFGGCHIIFGAHPLGLMYVCLLERGVWLGTAGVALGALTLGKEGIIYLMITLLTVLLRVVVSAGEHREYASGATDGNSISTEESAVFSERLPLKMSVAALGGFIAAAYEMILGGMNYTTLFFGLAMLLIPPLGVLMLSGVFLQKEIGLEKIILGKSNMISSRGKDGKELFDGIYFKISALILIFLIAFALKKYNVFGIDFSFTFVAFLTLFVCRRFGAMYGMLCGFFGAIAVSPLYAAAFGLMGAVAGALFPFGGIYAVCGGCIAICSFGAYAEGVLGIVSLLPEYVLGAALIFPTLGHIERVGGTELSVDPKRLAEDMVGTMALSYQARIAAEIGGLEKALHNVAALVGKFGKNADTGAAEYEIAARLFSDVRQGYEKLRDEDKALTEKVLSFLDDINLKHASVGIFGGRQKYLIVAGEDRIGDIMTSREFLEGLSEAMGGRLSPPEYYRRGSLALMVTSYAATLALESAVASSAGDSGEVSGDFTMVKAFPNHTAHAMVADGMGSGAEAIEVAEFCCDFTKAILGTGVGADTVFHALNAIVGKRSEECTVALDLFSVDLISGEASFVKSGAAFSYIKRGSSLFRLRSATMPIGVIKEVDAEKISAKVLSGDLIIMFSDGICDGGEDAPWLVELLSRSKSEDIKDLAEQILAAAAEHTPYKDDMTVLILKVKGLPN